MRTIRIRNVKKSFAAGRGLTQALGGVTMEIPEGDFVAIVGPNGCGKTTLLKIIAGLDVPSEGTVEFSGFSTPRPITPMVFQDVTLMPWRVTKSNVAFPRELMGEPKPIANRVVDYFLRRTGIKSHEEYFPHQLSGGYKRKAEIARALASEHEILLMDEPFRSLDAQARHLMVEELHRIWAETNRTVIYVTHDVQEAVMLSRRVAVMTARPGRIKEEVKVDVEGPRTLDILSDRDYVQAVRRVWDLLRAESQKALSEQHEEAPSKHRRTLFRPFF